MPYPFSLRMLREMLGITQMDASHRSGFAQSYISSRFDGGRDVTTATLAAYIKGLGGQLEIAAVFGDRRYLIDLPPGASSADVDVRDPG